MSGNMLIIGIACQQNIKSVWCNRGMMISFRLR